jgi:hypothetical protein
LFVYKAQNNKPISLAVLVTLMGVVKTTDCFLILWLLDLILEQQSLHLKIYLKKPEFSS